MCSSVQFASICLGLGHLHTWAKVACNFHKGCSFFISTKGFVDSINIFEIQITSKLAVFRFLNTGISLASFTYHPQYGQFFPHSTMEQVKKEWKEDGGDHQWGRGGQVRKEDKDSVYLCKKRRCRVGLYPLWGQKAEENIGMGNLWPLRLKQVGGSRIPFAWLAFPMHEKLVLNKSSEAQIPF